MSSLHAVKRLRHRMAQLTLTLGLADWQRRAIANEIEEWTARELGRLWKERP